MRVRRPSGEPAEFPEDGCSASGRLLFKRADSSPDEFRVRPWHWHGDEVIAEDADVFSFLFDKVGVEYRRP